MFLFRSAPPSAFDGYRILGSYDRLREFFNGKRDIEAVKQAAKAFPTLSKPVGIKLSRRWYVCQKVTAPFAAF